MFFLHAMRDSALSETPYLAHLHFVFFIAGIVASFVVIPLARLLLTGRFQSSKKIYKFQHGLLNINLPPKTMWMNMGYWTVGSCHSCPAQLGLNYLQSENQEYPVACEALLSELLSKASLKTSLKQCRLTDLGIGCGQQSLVLARQCRHYIGVTIDDEQLDFAKRRLTDQSSAIKSDIDGRNKASYELHLADAATPTSWSQDLKKATTSRTDDKTERDDAWILALDCLYHFAPSRVPIFKHAYGEMRASVMAFDLLLSPTASFWQRLLLRLLALVLGVPSGNFISVSQYQNQLVSAGFSKHNIHFHDISENVFSGLASFIEKHDDRCKTFLGHGVSPYKAFARVLRWWERTRVIRGVYVIARR